MATLVSSDSFVIRNVEYPIHPIEADQEGQYQSPAHRLFPVLALLAQRSLGCVLFLFGVAMVLSLWLMPLGLPLLLLGVALIAAPANV